MFSKYFTIEKRSHHFVITEIQGRAREVIENFAKYYIQTKLERVRGSWQKTPFKIWASRTADAREYRFHINQLPKFIAFLEAVGLPPDLYNVTERPYFTGHKERFQVREHFKERDYQVPIVQYLADAAPPIAKMLEIPTGKGKFQPLYSKVKIPGGWTTMGEIKVGDIVTAHDGTPTRVNGVFPQGEQDIYRLHFADGRSTEAGLEHLWLVYFIYAEKEVRWKVTNTAEIIRLTSKENHRVYIPLCNSEVGDDIALPMDPYTLGAIIGDGCLTGTNLAISKNDPEVFNEIKSALPDGMTIYENGTVTKLITDPDRNGNRYISVLRDLGLFGKLSHDKFIPKQYLDGSTQQRLALLQGLMDTDGTSEKSGSTSFSSTSEQLAKDVQYLVRSLGGIAMISSRVTSFTHKGVKKQGRPCYKVNIRFKKPSSLFRLPRKAERVNDQNQYAANLKLKVMRVEYVGKIEAQCISVEHQDHLYVTDDFVVTHNTFCALKACSLIGRRIIAVLKPTYIDKWVGDFANIYNMEREDVMVVEGSKNLKILLGLAIAKQLKHKAIIISSRTLQSWISDYNSMKPDIYELAGWPCRPDRLYEVLDAGVRLIDEAHQEFHLGFTLDLFTHIPTSISLSATMKSDDAFISQMYELVYPKKHRYDKVPVTRYIHSYAWRYRFADPSKLKFTAGGSGFYNHTEFEKCILKNPAMLQSYCELVEKTVRRHFLEDGYQKGERCLVYAASIRMCDVISKYLRAVLKDLDVRRYVEDDPYENLMEADLCVSTLGSAGTGHDIAMLTTVVLTTAVSSTQANIQGFGRLRDLPERKMKFAYYVCLNSDKQMHYHREKTQLLKKRALTHQELDYMSILRCH